MSEIIKCVNISPISGTEILYLAELYSEEGGFSSSLKGASITDLGAGYSDLGKIIADEADVNVVNCIDPCYGSLERTLKNISESLSVALANIERLKIQAPLSETRIQEEEWRIQSLTKFALELISTVTIPDGVKLNIIKHLSDLTQLRKFTNLRRLQNTQLSSSNPKIKYIKANAQQSTLADESQDIVFINYLLSHLENPYTVLKEANRILKPTGKVMVVDCYGNGRTPIRLEIEKTGVRYLFESVSGSYCATLRKRDLEKLKG